MAYKKTGGMDLGTLLIYGVGAYFVYTNWSSISAWFSNLTTPAATAAVPAASPTLGPSAMSVSPVSPAQVLPPSGQVVAPSSAGTVVALGPAASTPPPVTTMPPTDSQYGPGLTVQTGEGPMIWGQPVIQPAGSAGPLIPPYRIVSEPGGFGPRGITRQPPLPPIRIINQVEPA